MTARKWHKTDLMPRHNPKGHRTDRVLLSHELPTSPFNPDYAHTRRPADIVPLYTNPRLGTVESASGRLSIVRLSCEHAVASPSSGDCRFGCEKAARESS